MKKKYLLAPGLAFVPEHVYLEIAIPSQYQRTTQFSDMFSKAPEGDIL